MSEQPAPTPAAPAPPSTTPKPPRKRLPLWLKLLMVPTFACVGILALGFLLLQIEGWRSLRQWNQYRAHLAAQGEKLDLFELVPAPVPDEQNFALHPLISRWFNPDRNSTNSTPQWYFSPGAEDPRLMRSASGPAKNRDAQAPLLHRWSAYYIGHRAFPQAPAGSPPAEIVRTALTIYDADLHALRQAMTNTPRCRYPLDYQHGGAMTYPHLTGCRNLASTLQLRILAHLHLGRAGEAFDDLRLGLFLSDTLAADPLLASHQTRLSVDQLLWDALREGLCLRRWNDQQLAWLTAYLGRRQYLAEFELVLRGERNFAIHQTDLLSQGRIQAALGDTDAAAPSERVLKILPRGIYYHNLHHLVHLYQDQVLQAVQSQNRRLDKTGIEAAETTLHDLGNTPYNYFARQLLPAIQNSAIKAARWQTHGDALQVACALERHRLATGNLPARLEDLVPQYLPALPTDCLTGTPLKWRKLSDQAYRVYSPGWNAKDEGGQPGRRPEDGDWGVEITLLAGAGGG